MDAVILTWSQQSDELVEASAPPAIFGLSVPRVRPSGGALGVLAAPGWNGILTS